MTVIRGSQAIGAYFGITDTIMSYSQHIDTMRLLYHYLKQEGIGIEVYDPDTDRYGKTTYYVAGKIDGVKQDDIEFVTYAQAFDYLITEAIRQIKAKREIPAE